MTFGINNPQQGYTWDPGAAPYTGVTFQPKNGSAATSGPFTVIVDPTTFVGIPSGKNIEFSVPVVVAIYAPDGQQAAYCQAGYGLFGFH
jgi:hypothetical protein